MRSLRLKILILAALLVTVSQIGTLALLAAFIGAVALSSMITQPVTQLLEAIRRIRAGNYTSPVQVTSNDELGELATAFNAMQCEIADREERISYQARHDTLTGLPNRMHGLEILRASLQKACVAESPVSLLLADINSFSEICSSLGHDIGDALLSQAAGRLQASLDEQCSLCRLDGQEFLIIMDGTNADAAREVAADLLRLLDTGLYVHNVNISLDACIGICAFPEHSDDPNELLLRAAVAKNEARQAHDRISIYEDGQEELNLRQLAILGDLRRGVRHDELRIFFQPKINLTDGSICGAEALVRWEHPTMGFLPPNDFIPIAEKSGNISLITNWALTTSIRECRLWQEEGLYIPVSVNISGRDLENQNLPCFILELLKDHDLDSRYLNLEVTEQALVHNSGNATIVLDCLRDLGIRISIDDFGTGYSSLAQIKRLPVDEIKIDRSFVMELPDNRADVAIVRAVIQLAHSLGLDTLAEGVETAPAMGWLRDQGCERAQGFLFSRPMPAEAFCEWAQEYSVRADKGMMRKIQASGTTTFSGVARVTRS